MSQGISRLVDDLFIRYVRGPGHPCKLRFVGWLVRVWFKRLTAPTESGMMVLDTQDLIQHALFQYGHFEPDTCALHRALLKPGDVYVDVGSNVGAFSLLASQCVGADGKVVAIEPNPPIFSRLLQNRSLNAFATNVLPFCCACSDSDGFARLCVPPVANSGLARLTEEANEGSFMVATKKLSSLLANAGVRRVAMLKIDVEGHEYPVLSELFTSGIRPAHIVFEYLPGDFPTHEQMLNLIHTSGYTIKTLSGAAFDPDGIVENNLWATLETAAA